MALTDLFPPEHKNKVLAVAFTAVGVIFGVIILSRMKSVIDRCSVLYI